MLQPVKSSLASQYEAAFCTLNLCIDRCPEAAWNAPVGTLRFCQAVFHTLFFADMYLGRDVESLRRQVFHTGNPGFFADYEELEDRVQRNTYDRATTSKYLGHCRAKASDTMASETAESLLGASGFDWRKCSRLELHIYNIRHIQHHAAQMSLRLQLDHQVDIPWVGSGWRQFDPAGV